MKDFEEAVVNDYLGYEVDKQTSSGSKVFKTTLKTIEASADNDNGKLREV